MSEKKNNPNHQAKTARKRQGRPNKSQNIKYKDVPREKPGNGAYPKEAEAAAIAEFLCSFGIDGMIERGSKLKRRFIIHCGPTNSGKTYDSIQKLKESASGLYLGPLRLLALEMFDTINTDGIPCSLLTGEERVDVPYSNITASTIEMADFSKHYDTVVIDEAQLIADKDRGGSWTKAILLIDADEVHICVAPEALQIITSLIQKMKSPYEVIRHERLTPLEFTGAFNSIREVQQGDCLIAFSRKKVLGIAAALENMGIKASCIYGALPPATRREEVRRFTSGESKVVVATDAIGMGVSLPIKRIIFVETTKYDGEKVRQLTPAEIRQIAGRAGRYGIYDKGEVLAMTSPYQIRCGMEIEPKTIETISIPFPADAIKSDYNIRYLLQVWQRLPKEPGILRADMTEAIFLYDRIQQYSKKMSREDMFLYITRGVDTKQTSVVLYWLECCKSLMDKKKLPTPDLPENELSYLEQQYKCLDVLHEMGQFQEGFEDSTAILKERVSEKINAILKSDKAKFLLRCASCGKPLPINHQYGICDKCHRKNLSYYQDDFDYALAKEQKYNEFRRQNNRRR